MKIPVSWLKEFVKFSWVSAELSHRLTMAGLEIEAIHSEGSETVLELSITPNRGDCLSILGLAREVSALQGKALKLKNILPPKGQGKIKDFIQVELQDKSGSPRYMARGIRGVKIGPSPAWMQKRLQAVGIRPINNVVDCTNYVMWELGHPLHAFDHRFLNGQKIVIRKEKNPPKFKTLDGEERSCQPNDLFICDAQGPVALAGIMGGANSEVRDDTTDLVLEAASFDSKRIHATSRRLGLHSESSYRFARGVDPNGVANALHRVCALIVETAGGVPTTDWVDLYPKKIAPQKILLETKEVERILGLSLPTPAIKKYLSSLGFVVTGSAQKLQVTVPTVRFDVTIPVGLIEEIARLHGYEKLPATLPKVQAGVSQTNLAVMEDQALEHLTSLGFTETCSWAFVSQEEAATFADDARELIPLANPLSADLSHLRPSLMPGLLRGLAFNWTRQRKDVKLFELKKVFLKHAGQIVEEHRLGVVATGLEWGAHWQLKKKPIDFYSLKGLLQSLADRLHLGTLDFQIGEAPDFLVSTLFSQLYLGKELIGWIGSVRPELLKKLDIKGEVFALELNWSAWASSAKTVMKIISPSKFPFVERDMALIVDAKLPAAKVEEEILKTENLWIESIHFFDYYKGENLPADKKSLALNVRYKDEKRTLTNEEVNQSHQTLIAHLEKALPAKLR
ncbi:MAG: phenylalanine--tRNA ligase subunit beta [Deltaproteobacteria bacterium]|nr:phenylalanine--tRNA ligase subunit beta [Deltaproteobacteria bacterium]